MQTGVALDLALNGQMEGAGAKLVEYSHDTKEAGGTWMGGEQAGIDIAVGKEDQGRWREDDWR